MEYRYSHKWGFVVRVPKDEEYHYTLRWGFVFREKKTSERSCANFSGRLMRFEEVMGRRVEKAEDKQP